MAVSEEEIKLILNTQDSSANVHKLATEVVTLRDQMKTLATSFNEGTISEQQFTAANEQLTASLRDRSTVLETTARQSGILGKSSSDMGQLMLQSSYAVQDFTSQLGTRGLAGALGAVQNNIPGILAGLGAGAGLQGVLSVVSVAAAAALPALEKFFGAMDAEKVKAAADAIQGYIDKSKAMTTAPETPTEKGIAAEFQKLKGQGFDIVGMAAQAIESSPTGAIPTYEQEMGVQRYKALGGAMGPGGAAAALGLATSPEQLRQQLNAANLKRASVLVGQAGSPGDVGKKARNELRRLARDNPGAFPPQFEDFLKSSEETEGEARAAEAAIEEEEEKKFPSGKEALDRGKKANEAAAEAAKRENRIAQTYVEDALTNEREIDREATEAKRTADDAKRTAAAAARKADPSNRLRAFQEAQQDKITAEAMNQSGMVNDDPRLVGMVARQAAEQLPNVGGNIAMAVRIAVQQVIAKVNQDMTQQQMEIMNMGQDMGGMMPFNPPQLKRVR